MAAIGLGWAERALPSKPDAVLRELKHGGYEQAG